MRLSLLPRYGGARAR